MELCTPDEFSRYDFAFWPCFCFFFLLLTDAFVVFFPPLLFWASCIFTLSTLKTSHRERAHEREGKERPWERALYEKSRKADDKLHTDWWLASFSPFLRFFLPNLLSSIQAKASFMLTSAPRWELPWRFPRSCRGDAIGAEWRGSPSPPSLFSPTPPSFIPILICSKSVA